MQKGKENEPGGGDQGKIWVIWVILDEEPLLQWVLGFKVDWIYLVYNWLCRYVASQICGYNAQCVLCKVYFSAQPNKLRPILKFEKYYPIEHIFVPACSSARKIHFFKF